MAIIMGRVPPTEGQHRPLRVVVKLQEGVTPAGTAATFRQWRPRGTSHLGEAMAALPFEPYIADELDEAAKGAARRLEEDYGHAWEVLRRHVVAMAAEADGTAKSATPRSAEIRGRGWATLQRYMVAEVPDGMDPAELVKVLGTLDEVESAYLEGGPTPPPVNPEDDPRSGKQGYLNAAPEGIDARWAWGSADGSGVGVVDLERGWTLNHEDLAASGITIISGLIRDFHGHGTAVLGEIAGVDNTMGVVGIAPRARVRVVSQWRTATNYNTAAAIVSAAAAMATGDVLLLEAQTSHPNASGYVPVEVEDAVFDAIRAATDDGIIVVEAGANGSVNLDTFINTSGKRILDRSSADFRDSGAILVGAGSASIPHRRLDFSNFGSRIDCYAWGEAIETCGDGWNGTSTNAYTSTFGGTSGASPIVTGAALLLQSWRRARGAPYSPSKMRSLLSDSANTPSDSPAIDRIGVMPNLRALISQESQNANRYTLGPFEVEVSTSDILGSIYVIATLQRIETTAPVPNALSISLTKDWEVTTEVGAMAIAEHLAGIDPLMSVVALIPASDKVGRGRGKVATSWRNGQGEVQSALADISILWSMR